ncbi:ESPR domain-containing protein [Variovorax sp. WDL1]|uniref:ESPR domain-containing protein n=1 Tax=Variovorax sp. WDL1 TaxID=207745 RepID=UPI000A059A06|nr:ESPR-type extended signal peptide-containing protein [Variovorax sp. WDL1]
MNKHLHRIVFNAARGMRIVVQETARSTGKASGATPVLVGTALASLLVAMAAQLLNEVVSANPTQLRGAIEVGGQRAEVIVANPSGRRRRSTTTAAPSPRRAWLRAGRASATRAAWSTLRAASAPASIASTTPAARCARATNLPRNRK